MGELLADAQNRLASANGTFVRWLKQETGLSIGTAYRLINVYKAFAVSNLKTASFAPSALYLLADPSTPVYARTEAIHHATNGTHITRARAQEIVRSYQPPPMPPRPPRPALPPRPPSPEYQVFEREELMPHLHDAGIEDAPQMLSGQEVEPQHVPQEKKEQARTSLREAIVSAVRGVDTSDEEALEAVADEILEVLGQGGGSIAISARIGCALSRGPQSLSDLTAITAWVSGACLSKIERSAYLSLRKRTLRLLDSLTLCDGMVVFEHQLENGQLVYSLLEDPPDCPQ